MCLKSFAVHICPFYRAPLCRDTLLYSIYFHKAKLKMESSRVKLTVNQSENSYVVGLEKSLVAGRMIKVLLQLTFQIIRCNALIKLKYIQQVNLAKLGLALSALLVGKNEIYVDKEQSLPGISDILDSGNSCV